MMLFFELIQVSIAVRTVLSRIPSESEWCEMFDMSKKQSLAGICFAGVQKLPENQWPPRKILLKWAGLANKIRVRNIKLNALCTEVSQQFAHDGFYSCILKGQSNLVNYPKEISFYRTPGDIDIWVQPQDTEGIDIAVADSKGKDIHYEKYSGNQGVVEYVLMQHRLLGREMPDVQYHHVEWRYEEVECEVHFRPSWMNSPLYNARLQRWFKEHEQWCVADYEGFPIPTIGFNAVYQLVHIYRHLFNEGIGLRQLLDYYYVLKSMETSWTLETDNARMEMCDEKIAIGEKSKEEVLGILSSLGMKRFVSAVMWVLARVFDHRNDGDNDDWANKWPWMLCEPDENEGQFLLNEIMLAGNFGKYDKRNIIKADENYLSRFIRRQKRFTRFLSQYPSEVIWGPYFTVYQRLWRQLELWRWECI